MTPGDREVVMAVLGHPPVPKNPWSRPNAVTVEPEVRQLVDQILRVLRGESGRPFPTETLADLVTLDQMLALRRHFTVDPGEDEEGPFPSGTAGTPVIHISFDFAEDSNTVDSVEAGIRALVDASEVDEPVAVLRHEEECWLDESCLGPRSRAGVHRDSAIRDDIILRLRSILHARFEREISKGDVIERLYELVDELEIGR